MTDIDTAHPSPNPLVVPRRDKTAPRTFTIAVLVALLFHGVVGYYVWKAKVKPSYKNYSEQKEEVNILHPPPPPPPTPPPPPPPPRPRRRRGTTPPPSSRGRRPTCR